MAEKRNGWFVDFYNQWPAVFRPLDHNWQDWALTVFKVAGENSPYKRSWELEIGVIGFNWVFTYVYRDTSPDFPEPDSAGEKP